MKLKPIIFSSLWATSLAVAFYVGVNFTDTEIEQEQSTAQSPKRINGRAPSHPSSDARDSARARLNAAPMIVKGSSPKQMIGDIMLWKNAAERNVALLALIDTLSPAQFLSVAQSFDRLNVIKDRPNEYEVFLRAWAKVDPREALATSRHSTPILSTWVATDPEGALGWVESNHRNENHYNNLLGGVIEGLASHDIGRATELLKTLPRSEAQSRALRTLVLQLKDTKEAEAWVSTIEDEALRSDAYAYSAESLMRKNPSEAAEWLAGLGDVDALKRVGLSVTSDWYWDQPEEATAWVNTLPPEAMSQAAEGITGHLAEKDLIQAAEYLSQMMRSHPEVNFDEPITRLLYDAKRDDIEIAAIWVGGLSEAEQRRHYPRILGKWQKDAPEAANEWISQNRADLPEAVLTEFLGEVAPAE